MKTAHTHHAWGGRRALKTGFPSGLSGSRSRQKGRYSPGDGVLSVNGIIPRSGQSVNSGGAVQLTK